MLQIGSVLGVWAAEGFLHSEIGHKPPETASALVSVSASTNAHGDSAVMANLACPKPPDSRFPFGARGSCLLPAPERRRLHAVS